jgi:NTP pyrophosphatase (non-canonical NTP hydrolase)
MSEPNQPALGKNPTLADVQRYVAEMNIARGHSTELLYCMLLLCEEVGELAKAIRKQTGGRMDVASRDAHVDEEAADVLWLLLAVCNSLGVDLETAFRAKEEKNKSRVWQ